MLPAHPAAVLASALLKPPSSKRSVLPCKERGKLRVLLVTRGLGWVAFFFARGKLSWLLEKYPTCVGFGVLLTKKAATLLLIFQQQNS